jgi:apolipoprotein N-acyltransferase
VALVQGAIPQQIKWREEYVRASLDRYTALSGPYWGNSIIVWPETAVPAFPSQIGDFVERLARRAAASNTDLYLGMPTIDPATGVYYNSLVLAGRPLRAYNKRHLVPFGEYLPFKNRIGDLFEFLHIPMSDFTPGAHERPVLAGMLATAGISICYEDIFGEEVIEALPDADMLINVSNDAWFGNSAAPHQHLQMARMRSLETGRYMLRATNSGVSAIIDERGHVRSRSPQFVPTVLDARISTFAGRTPYSRTGNIPVLILLALGFVTVLRLRRTRRAGD